VTDPARTTGGTAIEANRLVVVANRLPIEPAVAPHGSRGWRRSLGGLVTALTPVVEAEGGAWVGWDWLIEPGGPTAGPPVRTGGPARNGIPRRHGGIRLHPLHLSPVQAAEYYEGYSNSTIWPLYHDYLEQPTFRGDWWRSYQQVNRLFARKAIEVAARHATVWVQDYHLQLVPALLRASRKELKVGFFLHIPVPEVEVFRRLPQAARILRGVLGADLIGFQCPSAATAFLRLAQRLLGLRVDDGALCVDGRQVQVRAFPASVDVAYIEERSERAVAAGEVARKRAEFGDRTVILGVERLDYTKGVEQRLQAYRRLLAAGQLDAATTVLVQVIAPSRLGIPAYRDMRDRIRALVAEINMEFGRPGRPSVVYYDHSLVLDDLIVLYRAADVMAVTPLRDGMNLVAKEYVAARTDLDGALVLSEFAGAADELRQAYLVNPFDPQALEHALFVAVHAVPAERRERMRSLRQSIEGHDARRWGQDFLSCLRSTTGGWADGARVNGNLTAARALPAPVVTR
jgi:trehalose 6-phosphate synthase